MLKRLAKYAFIMALVGAPLAGCVSTDAKSSSSKKAVAKAPEVKKKPKAQKSMRYKRAHIRFLCRSKEALLQAFHISYTKGDKEYRKYMRQGFTVTGCGVMRGYAMILIWK